MSTEDDCGCDMPLTIDDEDPRCFRCGGRLPSEDDE